MISYKRISRLLQAEWHHISCDDHENTDFVKGIVRGLKLADAMAKELWIKTRDQHTQNPMGSRKTFFKAICTAHNQLMRGDRGKCIETLEKVIKQASATSF